MRVLPLALEGAELAGRASSRAASDRVKFAIKAARKSAKKIRLIECSYLLRFRALVVQLYLQLYMIKNHDTPISSRFFNCDASLDMIDVGNC